MPDEGVRMGGKELMLVKFKPLPTLQEEAVRFLKQSESTTEGDINFIVSPYRVCPLGAHVDHQGGPVLGMTIDAYTILAFEALSVPKVRLYSLNFPAVVEFDLNKIGPADMRDWGRYAKGAANVLGSVKHLSYGFIGVVNGSLPSAGLSSSASVGLAYLFALGKINDLDFSADEFIRLDRRLENHYLGLQNGILDQATIINGRKDHLLYINTITAEVDSFKKPIDADEFRIIVAHSGFTRDLTSSGFNTRVEECTKASKLLGEMAGIDSVNILSDIPEDQYHSYRNALPENLRRRAGHFFSEVKCVNEGIRYWQEGDWANFGNLINESCKSSIENYESGSPPLNSLQEIFSKTEGVHGSRFSGGGYGGCVIGFVKPDFSDDDAQHIMDKYLNSFPEAKGLASIYNVNSEDGIRFL